MIIVVTPVNDLLAGMMPSGRTRKALNGADTVTRSPSPRETAEDAARTQARQALGDAP